MKTCSVENCENIVRCKTLCNRHYCMKIKYGSPIKPVGTDKRVKHGMAHTDIYNVWSSMKTRCDVVGNKNYRQYGSRGIKYNIAWGQFMNFYNDMRDGYKNGLTLDRTDNNKGYSKENCRWVDMKTQSNNRSNSIVLEIDGVKKTLAEWCDQYDTNYSTAYYRYKNGSSVSNIFNPKNR